MGVCGGFYLSRVSVGGLSGFVVVFTLVGGLSGFVGVFTLVGCLSGFVEVSEGFTLRVGLLGSVGVCGGLWGFTFGGGLRGFYLRRSAMSSATSTFFFPNPTLQPPTPHNPVPKQQSWRQPAGEFHRRRKRLLPVQ